MGERIIECMYSGLFREGIPVGVTRPTQVV